jgi:hypothetical protein
MRTWLCFAFSLIGLVSGRAAAPAPIVSAATAPAFHLFVAPQTLRSDEVTLLWDKAGAPAAAVTYEVLSDTVPLGSTAS